ncbi:MAG: TlyA family RNA methyltransferase [Candidatus Rokubacteria bacterium]|nr:TlyA family RNA methyltransferase [Candidatus Rokubacteria bacterium]
MRTAAARSRERLDRLLVARGLAPSREQAARLILAGRVFVDAKRVDKAGRQVDVGAAVEVKARPPYVSRGGEKLAHALDAFGISVAGRTCLDVGASTGGFTHCLLSRGAARVYAVDVGRGQLDAGLRADPRVMLMEKTNARTLIAAAFPVEPDLATVDVAFISLEKVLPAVMGVLANPGEAVLLVKPQFEVGRGLVGKGGVVRDPVRHRAVLGRLARFAILHGWHVLGLAASPLTGPKGNREFFLYLSRGGRTVPELDALIAKVTEGANT